MEAEIKRGWWWSPNSKKAHYFERGDNGGRSICRGFLVFATDILDREVQDNNDSSTDNCAKCKRLVIKMREQQKAK